MFLVFFVDEVLFSGTSMGFPVFMIYSFRPGDMDEGLGPEQFTGFAVQRIGESVAVEVNEDLSHLSP